MLNRKTLIEEILHNMHAMKHCLKVGYGDKRHITDSQGFVLRFVAHKNEANVKIIAEALHISSSAATQLVDGLVEKSYLVRKSNPDDRRAVTLSISEKAKKLFKEFKEKGLQKMTKLFDA